MNDLAERIYVPYKTLLKINGAECQLGQLLRVVHISRCFHLPALPQDLWPEPVAQLCSGRKASGFNARGSGFEPL
jgi:hypothetical protein